MRIETPIEIRTLSVWTAIGVSIIFLDFMRVLEL